jgi:hypothetical protein
LERYEATPDIPRQGPDVRQLETEIEHLVHALYGLTEEEITVVEVNHDHTH